MCVMKVVPTVVYLVELSVDQTDRKDGKKVANLGFPSEMKMADDWESTLGPVEVVRMEMNWAVLSAVGRVASSVDSRVAL